MAESGKSKSLGVAGTRAETEKLLREVEKDFSDEPKNSSKRKRR
jgi:hypothetical protein